MKKTIVIALLACGLMPVCAQQVSVAHQREVCAEQLLSEAERLCEMGSYPLAGELVERLRQSELTDLQEREAEALAALIAYHEDAATASVAIERYLKAYPDAPEQNRMRALALMSYYAQGDYAKVTSGMQEVDPDLLGDEERDGLILVYALAMMEEGREEEAALQLDILSLISDRYDDEVEYYAAYINYVGKRYEEAVKGFKGAQTKERYLHQASYYLAEIMLETKEYAEAEQMAADYIERYADGCYRVDMIRIQGEALYGQQRYLQAAVVLEEYLAKADHPKRETLYLLGMAHYNTGEHLRAPELFAMVGEEEDAVTQNALLHAGLSYLALDDKNKARLCFEQAAAMHADATLRERAMYNYAVCMHETSYVGFGETIGVFERFLSEFPQSRYADRVNACLVESYVKTRNYDAALQSIAKIQQPSTTILEAKQMLLYKAGVEAFARGDMRTAVGRLNESVKVGDYDRQTYAEALFWRGEAHFRSGNYNQASRDYAQYLKVAPDQRGLTYGRGLYGLGYTYFVQKNYQQAFKQFDRLMKTEAVTSRLMDKTTIADAQMRIGDCYFYSRKYTAAETAYNNAINTDPSQADYAVYQKAFTQGLSGRYADKVGTLTYLVENFPQSDYIDDALYEKGRAYVQLDNGTQAIVAFEQLVERYPKSQYAPKAGNEIALIHYQSGRVRAAIQAYKEVIKNYPGSEQAQVAMRDLKNLYVEENMVDSYVEYASQTKGMAGIEVSEHDSLTYKAAEMAYMRGDEKGAKESFAKYLGQFPTGAYVTHAHYYLGCIYYKADDYAQTKQHLQQVMAQSNSKYCEEATRMMADMAYNHKDYELALENYGALIDLTDNAATKLHAQVHRLRSAQVLGMTDVIVKETAVALANSRLVPEIATELRYYRAKAYLTQGKSEAAVDDLVALSHDTRNVYGAEAKYQLAQIYYNIRQYDKAEQEVLDYINVSTPHAYWLARSFVLLADVYIKKEQYIEAKQYLISLSQSYNAQDDIADMIEERLTTLESKMSY